MLVSILIPCYNAERWITPCIESALAQTWGEKEVIVVDDGSTDGSLAAIRTYEGRVRWETGPNKGGNAARNRLLDLARGAWVQYLDADDYLRADKIARQMKCLEDHPRADVIYGQVWVEEWNEAGEPLPLHMHPLPEPHDPWLHLARWRLPQTGGSIWRRQAVIDAGRWNEELTCCQEHELYLRLLIRDAQFVHGPDGGAVYRAWGGTTVSHRDPLKVARSRLQILVRMEEELAKRQQLSASRLRAINTTRFETARLLWGAEKALAHEVMEAVHRSEPHYRPEGPAAGALYRCLYALAGFDAAETLAAWVRGARREKSAPQEA